MGLANNIGKALYGFSGAMAAQSGQSQVPKGTIPLTNANGTSEGLLGLVYDVATAPMSYAKGKSEVPPIQSLTSLQGEPETEE